ncbi:F-box/kelch-repeat protein At3g06240 [Linum grandiflorum]
MDRRKQRRCDYFLPQDLIVAEILPRLSTTAAARFRCVCKSWRRLLSDHKFIHRQLIYGDEDHSDEPIVMITRLDLQDKSRLHYSLLSYDKLLPITTPYHDHEGYLYQYVPDAGIYSVGQRLWPRCFQQIVGFCNGLFCIADSSLLESSAVLILWNPSTSETKLLPNSRYRSDSKCITSGFGFDSRTGDYKVVRVFRDVRNNLSAEVYSLRNGSWRGLDGAKYDLEKFHLEQGIAWIHRKSNRGKIYCYSHYNNYIACFDFREERFTHQVFPAGLVERVHYRELQVAAASKDDSLMAVFRDKDDNLEIWGLLQYQSVESWTKLFRCDGSRVLGSIGGGGGVIGGLRGGEHIIVKDNSELLKVDFENEKVCENDGIRALSKSWENMNEHKFKAYSYVPSRVSIVGLLRKNIQDLLLM